MSGSELPERLVRFIRAFLPDYPSALLLVSVARAPRRHYAVADLVGLLGSSRITEGEVEACVQRFVRQGLLERDDEGLVHYRPGPGESAGAIADLLAAYDLRPVTLVRFLYRHSEGSLGSFADSFRIVEDGEEDDGR